MTLTDTNIYNNNLTPWTRNKIYTMSRLEEKGRSNFFFVEEGYFVSWCSCHALFRLIAFKMTNNRTHPSKIMVELLICNIDILWYKIQSTSIPNKIIYNGLEYIKRIILVCQGNCMPLSALDYTIFRNKFINKALPVRNVRDSHRYDTLWYIELV